jgi:hypothetical protein
MPATTRHARVPALPESTTVQAPLLYLALDLGERHWTLAFTVGRGQRPRVRTIPAGDLERLTTELAAARRRFGLPPEARVVSCYEAGRDGFWLHRAFLASGVTNVVVDAASIEVPRRARRAKTDRLDARKLVTMLVRYTEGERPGAGDRARLGLAALPTGERAQSVVPPALRRWERPAATDRDRRIGAAAADRALALRDGRAAAGRRPSERRCHGGLTTHGAQDGSTPPPPPNGRPGRRSPRATEC